MGLQGAPISFGMWYLTPPDYFEESTPMRRKRRFKYLASALKRLAHQNPTTTLTPDCHLKPEHEDPPRAR